MEKSDAKHYGTFENTEGSDSDTNTNYHYDPNEYLDCESKENDFDLSIENIKLFHDHTKNNFEKISKCCIFKYIALMITNVIVTAIYLHSLVTCPYDYSDPNVCIGYFRKMYPVWLFMVVICSLITYANILLCLHNVFPKAFILVPILNFVFCFCYQSGMEMDNHGGINRATFAISLGVLTTVHFIFYCFFRIYKYSKKTFAAVWLSIFFCIWLFYMARIRGSCKGWTDGLGDHQLINDGTHCNVPVPTLCELGIRNNWFDFVKFTPQCNKQNQVFDKSVLNDNINKEKVTLVGYPRTEWLPFNILATQSLYRSTIRNQIIDMNDPKVSNEAKDNVEFTVDLSNPQASTLNIHVRPNMTRANEQRQLRDNIIQQEKADGTYSSRMDKNVLIIYLDNLSRAHFYRKMPKTAEFINQFVDNQESDIL